jgi:hypothetical protein
VAALIIVLVILAVVVVAIGVARSNKKSVGPGPGQQQLPPGPGPAPNFPDFMPQPPNGQGSFVEQSRTRPSTPQPPPNITNGKPNSFGTVSVNTSAICRLTGKRTADCTCERCTKLKKKV